MGNTLNKTMTQSTRILTPFPRYLWFITLSYTTVIMLANWFDPRLVSIFGLTTDAGTIIFPLTFLLADIITEVYGYKHARRAIWCGFLFNALFIVYGQLVIHLPSPSYYHQDAAFDQLLAMNSRIIIASTISYFCSEPLNSLVIAKLKIKLKGRHIAWRFVMSTGLASGVDSFIFSVIAFYGVMNHTHLLELILTMWLIKVIIEMIGLPLSIWCVRHLKRIEQLDIYDRHTRFNLFRLDGQYSTDDNSLASTQPMTDQTRENKG